MCISFSAIILRMSARVFSSENLLPMIISANSAIGTLRSDSYEYILHAYPRFLAEILNCSAMEARFPAPSISKRISE